MSSKAPVDVTTYTGDETGILKCTSINGVCPVYPTSNATLSQHRSQGIISLQYISQQHQVVVLRSNSSIETYLTSTPSSTSLSTLPSIYQSSVHTPIGSISFQTNQGQQQPIIGVYDTLGNMEFINMTTHTSSITTVQSPINVVNACADGYGTAGRENDLRLFNLETKQQVWAAKNVPIDSLRLRVPIWIKDFHFYGNTTTSTTNASVQSALIVAGTAYKQMRLYDTRASPKPTHSVVVSEYCVTKVLPSLDGLHVYIGDVTGDLTCYDMRTLKRISTLASSAGAIRGLSLSDSGRYLLSVSLDRFSRVYDTSEGDKLVRETYLNNRLTCGVVIGEKVVKRRRDVDIREGGDNQEGRDNDEGGDGEDVVEEYSVSDDDSDDGSDDASDEEEEEEEEEAYKGSRKRRR